MVARAASTAPHATARQEPPSRPKVWRWIDEPDVSLTDYGLALESAVLAALIARRPTRRRRLRRWATGFFGATAIASLAGGTDHGFYRRVGRERMHDALWATSLLSIGGSALALVRMGVALNPRPRDTSWPLVTVTGAVMAYGTLVISGLRDFRLTLLAQIPATAFFLGALVRRHRNGLRQGSASAIAAVALSVMGSAGREMKIGFRPANISHNTLYHLVQALALALLFACLRDVIADSDQAQQRLDS